MASPKKGGASPNKAFVRKDPEAWRDWGSTSVPNCITRDPDMPPEECWAWTWLASHTSTFEVSAVIMWKSKTALSRNKAYELLTSLEDRGLLRRTHEVDERGIPYTLYDLQPVPVPPEQRTTKPKRAAPKPKKPFPAKQQDATDSRPSGSPGATRDDADPADGNENVPGFPSVRESGRDQGKRSSDGTDAPGGVSPDRAGETARPAKTDLNNVSESDVTGDDDPRGVSPDRAGESYKEEKTMEKTNQPGPGWLADEHPDDGDPDGVRVLRSLPYGIGDALSGPAVAEWSAVVGAALRSGKSEEAVIAKLTNDLPSDSRRHTKVVIGRRLPDLKTSVEQAPQRRAERAQSSTEQAHAKINYLLKQGAPGARQAAGLLGDHFDPEHQRGNTPAQEWLTERLPALSREYIEQHRDALVQAITLGSAA